MSRRRAAARLAAAAGLALVLVAGACADAEPADDPAAAPATDPAAPAVSDPEHCEPSPPARIEVEVLERLDHRADAYTQGLVFHDGRLYESTGRVGESSLRELDPASGEVLREVDVPGELFAEGLAADGEGRLVQLTWTDGVALVWDAGTFEEVGEHRYEGEGWGLAPLADALAMSDGSDVVTLRDPSDFSELGRHTVRRSGGAADRLNELEWDGRSLWANRYLTDELVRIDPDCWVVDGLADLSALRADAEAAASAAGVEPDVTNGVAHVPGTPDEFLLTGKYWPTMYRVRLTEAEPTNPDG